MPEIDIKKTIKEKRERLQMTAKELADAIGLQTFEWRESPRF